MISRVSIQQRGQFCANGAVTSVPIGSGNGQSGVPPKVVRMLRVPFGVQPHFNRCCWLNEKHPRFQVTSVEKLTVIN